MGVERRRRLGCAKLETTSYAVFSREMTVMWICITLALLQYNFSDHDVNQVSHSPPLAIRPVTCALPMTCAAESRQSSRGSSCGTRIAAESRRLSWGSSCGTRIEGELVSPLPALEV